MKISNMQKAFTLIELVIVVALLSILAAIALPKYMNFTGDARSALVKATGGSFSAGINMAHAKWELNNVAEFQDLNGDGVAETQFNEQGWPIGISTDGQTPLGQITGIGVDAHDACSEIIKNVINTTGITIIPANSKGECSSGDFCAKAMKGSQCEYTYRATKQSIKYNAKSGEVLIE